MTDLDLDGLDLGPLMNYMKEILYDRVEKHIDRGPRQIPIAVGAATAIFCHFQIYQRIADDCTKIAFLNTDYLGMTLSIVRADPMSLSASCQQQFYPA